VRYSFCTYFDHNYLPRGLVLYDSLKDFCPSFTLYILCLSQVCYDILKIKKLEHVHLISLDTLEEYDPELLFAKKNRSIVEYYFTLTPCLPLYILSNYNNIDSITYIDSDLCFFSDPAPIFEEIEHGSIAIIAHKFPKKLEDFEIYGKYNVGWITFRNDEHAKECLLWYREKCIEWCYDRLEDNRFADQKYLDYFIDKFDSVIVIKHKGANVAPWNVDNYTINFSNGKLCVDNEPLIFFHIHGLIKLYRNIFESGFFFYKATLTETIRKKIYMPYLETLTKYFKEYESKLKINLIREIPQSKFQLLNIQKYFPKVILSRIERLYFFSRVLISRTYIIS